MTPAEREELEQSRKHLAGDIKDDRNETTKDLWWQPICVARLVELERKDAADNALCLAYRERHAEQRAQQKWNAQADQYNQWRDLGQDEKDALIVAEMQGSGI